MADQPTVGNVLYPVKDMEAALAFYTALGLPTKFQDGRALTPRWTEGE